MNKESFLSISALRIYMKRGDNLKVAGWWSRLFEKPLSTYLVRAALRSGIMHAAVNLGHIGYAANAKSVSYDNAEIPMNTMPVAWSCSRPSGSWSSSFASRRNIWPTRHWSWSTAFIFPACMWLNWTNRSSTSHIRSNTSLAAMYP